MDWNSAANPENTWALKSLDCEIFLWVKDQQQRGESEAATHTPCVSSCADEGGPSWASRGFCCLWSPCLSEWRHTHTHKQHAHFLNNCSSPLSSVPPPQTLSPLFCRLSRSATSTPPTRYLFTTELPSPLHVSPPPVWILRDGGMQVSLFIFLLLSTFLIFPVSVSAFSSYNLTFSPQSVIETFCRDQFFLKSPTQFPKSGALLRKHHCQ